jgi:hypothetical protein
MNRRKNTLKRLVIVADEAPGQRGAMIPGAAGIGEWVASNA